MKLCLFHCLLKCSFTTCLFLQALPTTLELPDNREVFEDGENPPSSRSSESGFSDFVQYQGDGQEEAGRAPQPHLVRTGCRSSGPCQTKPMDKPVMQCCLEHFQQFLSRLIILYITPGHVDRPKGERNDVMQSGSLVSEGSKHNDHMESYSSPGWIQKECVAAFTAACQLFLECSSFPVYIAEGNVKSSPTQEEHFGKNQKSEKRKYWNLFIVASTFTLHSFLGNLRKGECADMLNFFKDTKTSD